MANNTISQVEINGTTYDLLDANTLSALDSLKTRVTTLEDSVALKNIRSESFTVASGVTTKAFGVYRSGNVVHVVFYFSLSIAKANGDILLTMGDNFPRPVWNDTVAIACDAINGVRGGLIILRSGHRNIIACNGPLSIGNYIITQFCYLTDE